MKISRMIELLKKVQENHGDCEVFGVWDDEEVMFKVTRVTYTDIPINGAVDDEGKPFYYIKANSCVLKLKEK